MPANNKLAQQIAGWQKLPNSSVPYTFSTGEPRSPVTEEVRPDGTRIIGVMRVPWKNRVQAARQDILESSQIVTKNGVQYISRTVPFAINDWLNQDFRPYLFASEIMRTSQQGLPEALGDGTIDQRGFFSASMPLWLLAALEILFTTRPYDIVSDQKLLQTAITGAGTVPDEASLQRYVYVTSQAGGSILPIPTGTFQAVTHLDGTTPAAQPGQPGINLPVDEILVRWFWVPRLAIGARSPNLTQALLPNYYIDAARGCVNLTNFPAGSANPYPPGTLLFTGFNPVPIVGSFGDRLYNCDFKFRYLNMGGLTDPLNPGGGTGYIGHNHRLTRITGDTTTVWRQLTVDGKDNFPGSANNAKDGDSIYNWRDFNRMFRVPQAGLV